MAKLKNLLISIGVVWNADWICRRCSHHRRTRHSNWLQFGEYVCARRRHRDNCMHWNNETERISSRFSGICRYKNAWRTSRPHNKWMSTERNALADDGMPLLRWIRKKELNEQVHDAMEKYYSKSFSRWNFLVHFFLSFYSFSVVPFFGDGERRRVEFLCGFSSENGSPSTMSDMLWYLREDEHRTGATPSSPASSLTDNGFSFRALPNLLEANNRLRTWEKHNEIRLETQRWIRKESKQNSWENDEMSNEDGKLWLRCWAKLLSAPTLEKVISLAFEIRFAENSNQSMIQFSLFVRFGPKAIDWNQRRTPVSCHRQLNCFHLFVWWIFHSNSNRTLFIYFQRNDWREICKMGRLLRFQLKISFSNFTREKFLPTKQIETRKSNGKAIIDAYSILFNRSSSNLWRIFEQNVRIERKCKIRQTHECMILSEWTTTKTKIIYWRCENTVLWIHWESNVVHRRLHIENW